MYTDLYIDTDAVSNIKDNKIYKSYTTLDDAIYMLDRIYGHDSIKNSLKININFICDNLKSLYNDIDKELTLVNNIEFENTRILDNATLWLGKIKLSLNKVKLNNINASKLKSGLNLSINGINNINNIGSLGNIAIIGQLNNFSNSNSIGNINNIGDVKAISLSNSNSFNNVNLQIKAIGSNAFSSALNSDISKFNIDSSLKNIGNFTSVSALAMSNFGNINNVNVDSLDGVSAFNNNLSKNNLNLNGLSELQNISKNWNQNNIDVISSVGKLYDKGMLNKEQFNSLVLANCLSNDNWNNLGLKNQNGEISDAEFKFMGDIKNLSASDINNEKLLSSLLNEDNQKNFDNMQLQLGKELLNINSNDSSFVSSLLTNGAFGGFNTNSNGFSLASIGLNSLSTENPYNSVILSTLLGVYISAYALLLCQDAIDNKNQKKKKENDKKEKKGGKK